MADYDYEKAAEANARAFKAAGIGMGGGQPSNVGSFFGGLTGASKDLESKFNPLSAAFSGVSVAGNITATAFNTIKDTVSGSLNTWRDLSSHGANFSNDLIKMQVSAAGTRMSMSDFSDVIKQNGASLSFLGGSVNKGAEGFAKMSDVMFGSQGFSKASDDLRSIGYTSTDLNKVLALSISMQRTTLNTGKDGEESQRAAIANAQSLAFEMDKNAKLLGVSRQEQMKVLEQAKQDSAIQARFKLIELTEGKDKAAAAREEYKKGLILATAQGSAELYKDLVANNGVVTSQAAANQAALLGKQADGITEMANATLKGNSEMMSAGMQKSMEGAADNDNNIQLLQYRTLGDLNKGVNDTLGKAAINSQTLTDNINARAKKDGVSTAEATKRVLADIAKEQKPDQTGGAQITDMAIKLGSRLDDVKAGIAQGVARPIVDKVAPDLKSIKDKFLSKSVAPVVKANAEKMTADMLGLKKEAKPAAEPKQGKSDTGVAKANEATPQAAQQAPQSVEGGTPATLNTVADKLDTLNSSVRTLSGYMESIKDLTDKQVRATKGLSNDRFAH
jgi:hypothetical protein